MTTLQTAVFDTKPYDRESLQRAASNRDVEWRFVDWRLSAETAASVEGARAVCIFVNDRGDRACLETLASCGVKHVALRCAGYNGVDIDAATELGVTVTRVPAYSPNVNLIERMWKFLRAKALSRWHKTFEDMQAAVSEVLDHLEDYGGELRTLMTETFHIIDKQDIPVEYREVA